MESLTHDKDTVREFLNNWKFAFMQFVSAKNDMYKHDMLYKKRYLSVKGESGKRLIKWECNSKKSFENTIDNQMKGALGLLVTQINSIFEKNWGEQRLQDSDPARRTIRCIIYQIRNAFAHNPFKPFWQVGKGFRHPFEIPAIGLKLDFKALDGKELTNKELPMLKLYDLVEYCHLRIPFNAPLAGIDNLS
jgi:hypothetical protein